jgi:hypothetical protein
MSEAFAGTANKLAANSMVRSSLPTMSNTGAESFGVGIERVV